jgi:hypothetical protein
MKKSLYSKLVLIMLTIIVSLMTVVGGFLMRGVRSFYQQQFYEQMKTVFSSAELASDLRDAADGSDAANVMAERLRAYAGSTGHRFRHKELLYPHRRHRRVHNRQLHPGKRHCRHGQHHHGHLRQRGLPQRRQRGVYGRGPADKRRQRQLYSLHNR